MTKKNKSKFLQIKIVRQKWRNLIYSIMIEGQCKLKLYFRNLVGHKLILVIGLSSKAQWAIIL